MRRLALLAALILAPTLGRAHNDAQWIAEGGYTGDDGVHCCGPADCERAPADAIRRIPGAWIIAATGQIFTESQPGFYESADLDWWWCIKPGTEHRRCLFRAQSAT